MMPRYVVLTHDYPHLHWDFMLEEQDRLRTWRLESVPDDGDDIEATPLPDHRKQYLDYEGPVSGNRGRVARWDAGEYRVVEETSARIVLQLSGSKLHGTASIASDSASGSTFRFVPQAG